MTVRLRAIWVLDWGHSAAEVIVTQLQKSLSLHCRTIAEIIVTRASELSSVLSPLAPSRFTFLQLSWLGVLSAEDSCDYLGAVHKAATFAHTLCANKAYPFFREGFDNPSKW